MKIGLSYSRCIKDLVEGHVDINDVLVIITRTDFDPHDEEQWKGIWMGYRFGGNPEWYDCNDQDEERYLEVTKKLWSSGKLHQPRKFGAHPNRRPEIWLEAVLPSLELARNPAAKDAWDKFQTVAGLTNIRLNREYQ
jgi:hypothetical protein